MSQAPADTRPVRFFHRGAIVEIRDAAPTRSALQWLREDVRACGTKEGCNEGDCGACTVMLGSRAEDGTLALRTVNACLTLLPMLDGRALFTVEDLKATAGGRLHPVQQALVECHGSQCGFCTPGFAMSMAARYERHGAAGTRPTRQQLADELSGNLCRCTGYRPILDAGERMFELPAVRIDAQPVLAALATLAADAPLHYQAAHGRYDAPRSSDALAAVLQAAPGARLLGGATDIGLWINKQFRELPHLVHVGEVAEMKRVVQDGDTLVIGAAVPLEDAWSALAERVPALRELWLRFASPPVRHAGTLGGNLANGSPIGDGAPALIALGASLRLRSGAMRRVLPLEDFYVDYMKNQLGAGEFIEAIEVPLPSPAVQVRGWKLSKRYDSDICGLACGLALTLAADGTVADARFAFGGMAAIVKRARAAEQAVVGQPWSEPTIEAAAAALASDYTPLTDLRASRDYRLRAAGNLLRRLWLETRAAAPLAPSSTSVWHARLVPAGARA